MLFYAGKWFLISNMIPYVTGTTVLRPPSLEAVALPTVVDWPFLREFFIFPAIDGPSRPR